MIMEDIVATAPGDILVTGSKLNPEAKTGQNGGLNPSAIQTNGKDFQGKPLPYSTVAQSIKATNKAQFIPEDDPTWQNRKVSAAPIKATAGMKRQQTGTIGTLPKSLGYGPDVPQSVKPAKLGIFKR
jgi:hypothetical protein